MLCYINEEARLFCKSKTDEETLYLDLTILDHSELDSPNHFVRSLVRYALQSTSKHLKTEVGGLHRSSYASNLELEINLIYFQNQ